jgi:ubiquitin-protein ligase
MNEESMYYGGYFKAKMTFPRNYPHSPPGMSLPIRRFQQGKSREAQGRS